MSERERQREREREREREDVHNVEDSPTRMVYLYYIISLCLRYTILIGSPHISV